MKTVKIACLMLLLPLAAHSQQIAYEYDAAGQTLIRLPMTSSQATLDLSQYANGYYLLKVNVNDNITTYKIIKK